MYGLARALPGGLVVQRKGGTAVRRQGRSFACRRHFRGTGAKLFLFKNLLIFEKKAHETCLGWLPGPVVPWEQASQV